MVDGEGYVNKHGAVEIEIAEEEFAAAIVATMWMLGWQYSYRVSLRVLDGGRVGQRHRIHVAKVYARAVADMVRIRRKRERLLRK